MTRLSAANRIIKTVLLVGGTIALLLVLWLTVGTRASVRDAAATGNLDLLRDGTFTVWFSGLEIQFRWCQFRLWWK